MAAREGIKLVLVGTIVPDGSKFDLVVKANAPLSGEVVAEASATAVSKPDVHSAMGSLTADLREQLGKDPAGRRDR